MVQTPFINSINTFHLAVISTPSIQPTSDFRKHALHVPYIHQYRIVIFWGGKDVPANNTFFNANNLCREGKVLHALRPIGAGHQKFPVGGIGPTQNSGDIRRQTVVTVAPTATEAPAVYHELAEFGIALYAEAEVSVMFDEIILRHLLVRKAPVQ